jgi:hypothetical protein
MSSSLIFRFFSLAIPLSAVLAIPGGQDARVQQPQPYARPAQCNGKASDCKEPVKFLSKEGDCVCFSCEYGTKTQNTVCTDNQDEQKALVNKEKDRPPQVE